MRRVGCTAFAVLCVAAATALAGRPLTIDDADPVEPGLYELELGAGYVGDADCDHWDFPIGLGRGLVPGVEAGIGFGGQLEERTEILDDGTDCSVDEEGLGDLVVAAKWQIIKKCPLGARHAIVPSVKFPTADDDEGLGSGETDYDLTWVVSRAIGEKAGAHLNGGYSWIGGPDEDVIHYGLALDYRLAEALQWVGEVFAEDLADGEGDTAVLYNIGFRWSVNENLIVDVAGGSKLNGEEPDFFATAGLTWYFGTEQVPGQENN